MSNLACELYPLNHPVFSGGRYLRAFDHLPDIDSREHHLLIYLGSFMPFDVGFVDEAAYPSVSTIARALRMSESTVRKKAKSLERKGYLRINSAIFTNTRGKFEQRANRYFFTLDAFKFFEGVLEDEARIKVTLRKGHGETRNGQIFPIAGYTPPPVTLGSVPAQQILPPIAQLAPNSLNEIPTHPQPLHSSCIRDLDAIRSEVDNIAEGWKEVVGVPVGPDEKERFLAKYVSTRGNELYFLERTKEICECVYLLSRAKSINFLFSGLDMAKKNRQEIRHIAMRALNTVDTEIQLDEVIAQLPQLIAAKSKHFAEPSPALVNAMLQDLINSARQRLCIPCKPKLPTNDIELRREIDRILKSDAPADTKERLTTVRETIGRMNFSRSLELFARHAVNMEAV
jgi:DNA-binding MarR family transcriptional regulator